MTLRLTGILPPAPKTTPAFQDLLHDLGVRKDQLNHTKQTKSQPVQLKKSEMNTVYECGYAKDPKLVWPCGQGHNTVSGKRGDKPVTWHTASSDINKSTSAHHVCWVSHTTPWPLKHSVDDLNDFNFGIITKIVTVSSEDQEEVFVRVQKYQTVCYEFGGTWKCNKKSLTSDFVPLKCISQPLITANLASTPDIVYVLNSKVRLAPMEARTINEHMTIK